METNKRLLQGQTSSSSAFSTRAVLKYLQQTYRSDGVVALYRGNSATMARIMPYAAIQFTAHEQWKRVLGVDTINRDSEWPRFLAGSLAGVTAQTLTYPLDMTRARLAISPKTKYKNLADVFIKVVKEGKGQGGNGGVMALYRGYVPTMMGVIPYAGFSFYTYETLKRAYHTKFGEESGHAIRSGSLFIALSLVVINYSN
jgi:solute carrier family 25 protein 42